MTDYFLEGHLFLLSDEFRDLSTLITHWVGEIGLQGIKRIDDLAIDVSAFFLCCPAASTPPMPSQGWWTAPWAYNREEVVHAGGQRRTTKELHLMRLLRLSSQTDPSEPCGCQFTCWTRNPRHPRRSTPTAICSPIMSRLLPSCRSVVIGHALPEVSFPARINTRMCTHLRTYLPACLFFMHPP